METTRIMLCEDELIFATELQDRLDRLGYDVTGIASDEETALRLARETKPDFVMMDIRLTGSTSGIEIAHRLDNELSVPSLFLTAYADAATLKSASTTNVVGYLTKPVSEKDLELAVRFAEARSKALREARLHAQAQTQDLDQMRDLFRQTADITMRLEREQALKAVVAQVAHHMNNSLSSIFGHLDILNERGDLPPYEEHQLRYISEAAARQRHFLQRLLWSAETGFYLWNINQLQDVIEEAINNVKSSLPREVVINFETPREPASVFICADAVREAIEGILVNAVQAVGKIGTITVRLTLENMSEVADFGTSARPGDYFVVAISDTGPGIDSGGIEQSLEPFYASTLHGQVAGLGLSVAYGVSRGHGGGLRIQSEPEIGTSVKIFLPHSLEKRSQ